MNKKFGKNCLWTLISQTIDPNTNKKCDPLKMVVYEDQKKSGSVTFSVTGSPKESGRAYLGSSEKAREAINLFNGQKKSYDKTIVKSRSINFDVI